MQVRTVERSLIIYNFTSLSLNIIGAVDTEKNSYFLLQRVFLIMSHGVIIYR